MSADRRAFLMPPGSNWRAAAAAVLLLACAQPSAAEDKTIKVEGYAEWRRGDVLTVDGQRVRASAELKFKGHGEAKSFSAIPLGYEVTLKGIRLRDGTVLAREAEAKPNGEAMFEGELITAFDEMEERYREEGSVFDEDEDGEVTEEYGTLLEEGPQVERARGILEAMIPPYADPEDYRLYVVENEEWNAMAAPNGAIFVFSGLLDKMDDDEVAIILGHELAHATHEHSRRHYKKDMLVKLAALGVVALADRIDDEVKKAVIQVAALLGASAWSSGYGRGYEDQADRVGLRYAFEGGYDVGKGPALWGRFAKKYGEDSKVLNFFFSDHSMHKTRAKNLEREIENNYRD